MTTAGTLETVRAALEGLFGAGRVVSRQPLAALTTFKVGGPADLYFEPRSAGEVVATLRTAHAHGVPVTMLGGGSNVLVADAGIRGLVLRPRGGHIERVSESARSRRMQP